MATWILAARARGCCPVLVRPLVHYNRSFTKWTGNEQFLNISDEVRDGLATFKPVVALETTIITHGMPYPHNIETALRVEDTIRDNGGIPATIGIINGKISVGLSQSQLHRLADPNQTPIKVSRRDLSIAVSQGLNGGTTVSGTMVCANAVGIPIFVTGGIGGVHRDGQDSLDISTDLTELGQTNTAVISSGIKSILDIERTLEYLETQGVTVATYGPSKEFPAFFTSHSGINVEYNLTTPLECAQLINTNNNISLTNGLLIGVPIPIQYSINNIDTIIQQSLLEARNNTITGKAVTPYVLKRINQLSNGQSLSSNISLIINNAIIGTLIAVQLSVLQQTACSTQTTPLPVQPVPSSTQTTPLPVRPSCTQTTPLPVQPPVQFNKPVINGKPVVIGASILDFIAKTNEKEIKDGTNVGTLRTSYGGVARNIAESLARLDCDPFFISVVGNDLHGNQIINHLKDIRMRLDGVHMIANQSSSTYCAVLDGSGEVYCAIGDMESNERITIDWVSCFKDIIQTASIVCIDSNNNIDTIKYVCQLCHEAQVPVWFEPTCIRKCIKPLQGKIQHLLSYASPNIHELINMSSGNTSGGNMSGGNTSGGNMSGGNTNITDIDDVEVIMQHVRILLQDIPVLLVTCGSIGVLYADRDKGIASLYPIIPTPVDVISVSGAGDCLVGGVIAGLINNYSMDTALVMGLTCANRSIQSIHTVPTTISKDNILTDVNKWKSLIVPTDLML